MEEETNPFLAMRAAKIARNEARLRELGLLRPTPKRSAAVSAQASRPKATKRAALPRKPIPSLRRSSRHSDQPGMYTELPEPAKRRKTTSTRMVEVTPEQPSATQAFPPHSARSMNIHVENLVLGGLLGTMMEQTGKAVVMQEAAQKSGHDLVSTISFNKYSGVQEWQNDALFLWVNLGAGGDVVNDFLNGGRQISWFGGSRMHDETRVIQRLLRVGKSVANAKNESSNGLVLWCRSYDASRKTFTPYVCLGRLSYHSHEPGSQPLKFIWNLVDYDGLVNHEDETVRSTFEDLVNSS